MGKILGGLFGGSKPPDPQPAPPPTPMEDPEAIARKKREAANKATQRGGRSSTILSDSDTLG